MPAGRSVRPPHAEDHYAAIYDEIWRRKLVQSHIWDCYGASESPQPANEIRAGIRERLFCDRRQLCAANGIPPSPDRPTTSSTTFVIRFISLIRFSLSAVRESEGENHASEATLCLASHTGPGSVSVLTSKLGTSLIRKSKDFQL